MNMICIGKEYYNCKVMVFLVVNLVIGYWELSYLNVNKNK